MGEQKSRRFDRAPALACIGFVASTGMSSCNRHFRAEQSWTWALECQASPAEALDSRSQFRQRCLGMRCVQHDQICRIADDDAVIRQVHQLRRKGCYHVDTVPEAGWRHLCDICIEIRHPQERSITEWRERVQHVVGRNRAGYTLIEHEMGRRDSARDRMRGVPAGQIEIRGRQDRQRNAGCCRATDRSSRRGRRWRTPSRVIAPDVAKPLSSGYAAAKLG
jgi:hypothetical protein